MASAFDSVETRPQVAPPERFGWLRANAGSFAIAGAVLIAAGTYGFVSSPAFATFFMGLIIFVMMWLMAAGAIAIGGWVNEVIVGPLIALTAVFVLFSAVEEAQTKLRADPVSASAS